MSVLCINLPKKVIQILVNFQDPWIIVNRWEWWISLASPNNYISWYETLEQRHWNHCDQINFYFVSEAPKFENLFFFRFFFLWSHFSNLQISVVWTIFLHIMDIFFPEFFPVYRFFRVFMISLNSFCFLVYSAHEVGL